MEDDDKPSCPPACELIVRAIAAELQTLFQEFMIVCNKGVVTWKIILVPQSAIKGSPFAMCGVGPKLIVTHDKIMIYDTFGTPIDRVYIADPTMFQNIIELLKVIIDEI